VTAPATRGATGTIALQITAPASRIDAAREATRSDDPRTTSRLYYVPQGDL
jgi:hypothetical protein